MNYNSATSGMTLAVIEMITDPSKIKIYEHELCMSCNVYLGTHNIRGKRITEVRELKLSYQQ